MVHLLPPIREFTPVTNPYSPGTPLRRTSNLFVGRERFFRFIAENAGHPDQNRVLILRMRHVPFIDATGLHRLADIIRTMERRNVRVLLTDVVEEVEHSLREAGVIKEGMLFGDVRQAISAVEGAVQ